MDRYFRSRALFSSCALAVTIGVAFADDAPIGSGQRPDGKVRADILSLRRTEGETVTLRFALINDSNQPISYTLGNMKLIDLVGRLSYSPGVTSANCRAEPGSRAVCWAIFGAPNQNTKTINLRIDDDNFDLIPMPIGN